MKTLYQSLLLALGALALAGTAFAQVPSTNDTSDAKNNTGMGTNALLHTPGHGSANTASGFQALYNNTNGEGNTASGVNALYSGGNYNTASGENALYNNIGSYNTASGVNALYYNTTGGKNTASGDGALYHNTKGGYNTASGTYALLNNTTGSDNTASGAEALYHNTTGNYNIAVGLGAGYNLTTGSNNIDIDNTGVAGEGNTIRIGANLQAKTFIAGIYNNTSVSGLAVVIDSNGQLGAMASSERFKTAITPMGSNSEKLQQLRPVTFRRKSDPKGALQYGLIAEEVAKVYPELVIRGEKGRIDGVRYDELAPMLLNEMQKKNVAQDAEIRDLKQQQLRMQQQMAELKTLNQATQVALQKLQAKDELMAQR